MNILTKNSFLKRLTMVVLLASLFAWYKNGTTFVVSAVSESDCLNNTANLSPDDVNVCLTTILPRIINAYAPAQEKNKQDLAVLQKQLSSINKQIASIQAQLKKAAADIKEREENLAYAKEIFEQKAKSQYVSLRFYDPLLPFLTSSNATDAFREIALRQRAAEEDRKVMEGYAQDLAKLKTDKESLEKNQASLSSLQKQVAEKEKFLAGEVSKVDTYLSALSAKQQELQAIKEGGFSTSVGDVPGTLEPCSGKPGSSNFCDPGFRPAFAAFSYGAPHRKGMSQYGAYGRAKAEQSAEQILSAYYGGVQLRKDYSTDINIRVTGYSTVDIETYVKRIYEMPIGWTANDSAALKAQAVAARSYALAYTNNGAGSICATESCQVYKPTNKGGAWDAAVDATRGWVLVSGGNPFSAWYASTAGGYTFSYTSAGHTTPNLWDNTGGNKDSWQNNSYEILGGSPWFYKGWYKSRGGSTCGRGNPWLTSEEVADVLNAWKVIYQGGGDVSRISPIDTNCWGGNPYSKEELRNIGGFSSVSSVSQVIYGNDGSTVSVRFSTNQGDKTITGAEFKKAFNLRAPGYIGIKSSLFNIESL
jgi:hypothetical protein